MKFKKITALAATLVIGASTCGVFSGCGTVVEDDGYDPTKANLTVGTYDGGVGEAWLKEAAARFTEMHKNSTHFQEGRTGVNIMVSASDKYAGSTIAEKSLDKDVYFTESVEYYTLINQDKVANITDVVTASLEDYGEVNSDGTPVTIESKLDASFQDYLTAKDGNYYMIPFYDGFYGFIYDVDLFEEQGFYVDDNGNPLKLKKNATEADRKTFEEKKSDGPDGLPNTYDDGLPATYQQLIDLCEYIAGKSGYAPFCYSGQYVDYVTKAFRSAAVDYEGYDAFKVNYTLTGDDVKLVKSINSDGSLEFEYKDIQPSNAYELQKQAGKYYALWLQEKLFGTSKYIGGSYNSFDYLVAQDEFITSKYSSLRYAMLAEGVWWENEAEKVFTDMEELRGEAKGSRRFGLLPMPKAPGQEAGPQTLFSANSSFGFINKSCENMELAKEFMRFLHTDSEMSKFSASTSIPRSLNYEVAEADRANATHFGKTLIDMRAQAKVIYPYSSTSLVLKNPSNFTEGVWFSTAKVDGRVMNNPFTAFQNKTATAAQFFNGLYTYQKDQWSTLK
ncbi:MAG: hypothetical protein IJF44_01265 [Clostridia bacterium]|nr:hypothetical protein [Clostridia bacterium]